MSMNTRTWALIMALFLLLIPTAALSAGAKTVWVTAYTKGNGTYVSGHWRSPPDSAGVGSYSGNYYTPGYSSSTASTTSGAIENNYRYTVHVYRKGVPVGYGKSEWSDSQVGAEESALWQAQEGLRRDLYKAGLGHEEVQVRLDRMFSQESCKLDSTSTPHPTVATIIYNESTMTCIAPTAPEAGVSAGKLTFPFTCAAVVDAVSGSTPCWSDSGIVVLYHAGESVFKYAEEDGWTITVSSLPDGHMIASVNGENVFVKLQPAR